MGDGQEQNEEEGKYKVKGRMDYFDGLQLKETSFPSSIYSPDIQPPGYNCPDRIFSNILTQSWLELADSDLLSYLRRISLSVECLRK